MAMMSTTRYAWERGQAGSLFRALTKETIVLYVLICVRMPFLLYYYHNLCILKCWIFWWVWCEWGIWCYKRKQKSSCQSLCRYRHCQKQLWLYGRCMSVGKHSASCHKCLNVLALPLHAIQTRLEHRPSCTLQIIILHDSAWKPHMLHSPSI